MKTIVGWLVIVSAFVLAYLARDDSYIVELTVALAFYVLGMVVRERVFYGPGLTWPLLLARTIYFNSDIRVSVAYLIAIPTDGTQLLIRGRRIATQFQPVGGVYKTHFDETQLMARFRAQPDSRFAPDPDNRRDLRIRLKGRDLPRFMNWFETGKDRESMPVREFYEELVRPGLIPSQEFAYFDCSYIGRRTFGLEFDDYSQCKQLIICDVYLLRPNNEQQTSLRILKDGTSHDPPEQIYFASPAEIRRGGSVSGATATFEIARTARWLNDAAG